MSATTQILIDKLALINWITELNDNRVLDKLRFLMENNQPKKVVAVQAEEIQDNENLSQSETSTKAASEPTITDADTEAFDENMKERFPHLFK